MTVHFCVTESTILGVGATHEDALRAGMRCLVGHARRATTEEPIGFERALERLLEDEPYHLVKVEVVSPCTREAAFAAIRTLVEAFGDTDVLWRSLGPTGLNA